MPAAPLHLDGALTIEQGFKAIAASCREQVLANAAGVLSSEDGEFLHQMRIGVRRLRLTLRLFAPAMEVPPTLAVELAWLGKVLGRARDATVIADQTLPAIASVIPAQAAWEPLCHYARARAQRHRAQVRRALASQRYARLEQSLRSWLQDDGQGEMGTDTSSEGLWPLRPYAKRRVRRLKERLAKARTAADSEVSLHGVRIAAKKLRYAIEFFAPFYSARRIARHLRRLGHLQQQLGELNDASVACVFLRGVEAEHPELAASAALSRGYLLARAQQHMEQFRKS